MGRRKKTKFASNIVPEGKPAPKNSSQLLMSVDDSSKKSFLVPTVVGGVQMKPRKAVEFAKKHKLFMGPFSNHLKADRYSRRLSDAMGTSKKSPFGRLKIRRIFSEK